MGGMSMDELDDIINGLASGDEGAPAGETEPGAEYDPIDDEWKQGDATKSAGKGPARAAGPRVKPIEKWLKNEILEEITRLQEQGDTPQRADFIRSMPDVKKMKKAALKKQLMAMWKIGLGGPDQGPLIEDDDEPAPREPVSAPRAPPETVYVAAKPNRNVLDPPRPSRKLDEGALDQLGEQMAGFNLIVVHTVEGVSQQIKPAGYVIEGAAEKLAQPELFGQVKECMKEIASEVGPDDPVIRTMSNPWFKYAMLMTSVLASSAKKAAPETPEGQAEAAGTVRQ